MARSVFLDRDGVINSLVWNEQEKIWDTPYRLEEFKLLPDVPEAINEIHALGFLVIVVSNQPGIAKGKSQPELHERIHQQMIRELERKGAMLDDVFYCFHHPQAMVPHWKENCSCRKPKPGMLFEAAAKYNIDLKESFLIGDRERDILAGRQAGCRTILIGDSEYVLGADIKMRAKNLPDAMIHIRTSADLSLQKKRKT